MRRLPVEDFPEVSSKPSNFVDLLRTRALHQPERQIYTFLPDGDNEAAALSYGELDLHARAIAARLQAEGAAGDRVLLMYPAGLEYIAAFFGCLYAGMIAVPVYPPRPNRTLQRLESIIADAGAKFALTTDTVLSRIGTLFTEEHLLNAIRWLATDKIRDDAAIEWRQFTVDADTLAYLQYTSGSTSAPKGVMVSHANLLSNSADMDAGWQHTRDSVLVSWLPHFHDMGLIYGILQPLYKDFQAILMPPVAFLQQPARWLQTITRYKGTHSAAPNFAYELCVRKVTSEQRASIDLSSWVVAVNGAEPVRRETLERFIETFEPCGFRRRTFCPGYGLAEATLKVSATSQTDSPMFCSVRSDALAQHRVVEALPGQRDAQTFVGCGRAMLETKIAIVHPESSRRCAAGEVGEICVAGPSVAGGYWKRPAETARDFRACLSGTDETYLRTGDLGFIKDGELFVTGRLKDLIIIRGRNHYPQDIELTAEQSHPALRPGCGAAFSVEVAGAESLVVVQEIERTSHQPDFAEVCGTIRQTLAAEHELHAYVVVLIKSGSLPKTSSGKVQRHVARARFLADTLDPVAVSRLDDSANSISSTHLERESLLALEPSERQAALANYLLEQLALQLGSKNFHLDSRQPLGTLGLDSLMAVELRNRIETELHLSVSPSRLLGDGNLNELAAELLAQLATETSVCLVRSVPTQDADEERALSYGQRALWFMRELDRASAAYNIMYAARITSELDVPNLQRAWQSLINQHASLRTTYHHGDGEPVQKIHAHLSAELQEIDASNWSAQELSARLKEAGELPFALERGPCARLQLFRRTAHEHILLLSVHHIACDFWSLDILIAELRAFYMTEKTEGQVAVCATDAQYVDFVRWQAEMLGGAEGEAHWSYWQSQLSGELPVLNLPTDRPRPLTQTFCGTSQTFPLNENLVRRLRTLAQAEGTTLFTFLLAAFQVLLHRYTGQQDILVGAPTAGRSRGEFTDVVGYFVNPVTLRADLSGDPSFRVFLAQARNTVLSAMAHEDYPFPLLTQRLQPVRDPGRSPLFQVTFAWEKLQRLAERQAFNTETRGALELDTLFWSQGGAPFDLMLSILEAGELLGLNLHYNTDLFDETTIGRIATHFQTMLEGIAVQPEQRVSELPLLSETEQEQLLFGWNDTRVDFDKSVFAHQLFEAQAARTPDASALVFGDTHVTYRELNARGNRLARYLRARGVGAEVRVAVCMERTVESVVGILGVSKAGGAYVPLDPTYPKERLAFMLADARAQVLITVEGFARELPEHAAQVVCLDTDSDAINLEDSANLASDVVADNLAYVIYTSGSTGQPKGVQISHAALLNLICWHRRAFEITAADKATQLAGVGFDASVWELWPYLTLGASLHLLDDETRTSPERLMAYLLTKGITISFLPTPLAESVLALDWPEKASLRVMLTGGDKLHRYPSGAKPFALVNNYGPTENTVVATSGSVACGEESTTSPSIGRPISNAQVYLLDAHWHPVAIGTPGELYVGGASLTRGYLNRPGQTAEKLIPHPFSIEPGARLYRTGDLARYLPDGQIEFLGRLDQQVKIRGFRIELEEIESVLAAHPALQEAAVLAREDAPGDKRLVAYVVATRESSPSTDELRGYLKEKLPGYMMPSAFLFLSALPLTANGKIDRRALPVPDSSRSARNTSRISPRTPVEEVLAKIWCEVLGLERVGVEDNFFELGGHSLLMAGVVSRVRESLQLELPLRTLLEAPTVSSLAEMTEEAARTEHLDAEKIARLWLMVEQLSAADIETALLQEKLFIRENNAR
jgi:amino acid adenylation domain-containing protein